MFISSSRRYSSRTDDTFSQKRCLGWFNEYTTAAEPETLGPESMERFCEDIGVEPENVAMLVIAYKMGARQMGYFTQAEWMKGMTELQCDSAAKMPAKLEAIRAGLSDYTAFKGVYRYAYDFARVSVCLCVVSVVFADVGRNSQYNIHIYLYMALKSDLTNTLL